MHLNISLVKFLFLLFLISFINTQTFSQSHFFMSVFAGAGNYRGDLGKASLKINNTQAVGGVGMVFQLNHRMLVRTEMNFGKVSGSDKYDLKTRNRNLSFTSKITEVALLYEYILFDLYEYKISPYVFVGISTFKFSPYTKDRNGNTVFLAEQSTEGQGFYKDRKNYKLNEIAIPLGGGVQWALSPNKRIAVEIGLRKTTTDYLDDVSTTYINPAILAQKRGSTAVNLAYRGGELLNAEPYPADGAKRGNPNNNDWYIFTGLSFRISIKPKPRLYTYKFKRYKTRTSCPKVF